MSRRQRPAQDALAAACGGRRENSIRSCFCAGYSHLEQRGYLQENTDPGTFAFISRGGQCSYARAQVEVT